MIPKERYIYKADPKCSQCGNDATLGISYEVINSAGVRETKYLCLFCRVGMD